MSVNGIGEEQRIVSGAPGLAFALPRQQKSDGVGVRDAQPPLCGPGLQATVLERRRHFDFDPALVLADVPEPQKQQLAGARWLLLGDAHDYPERGLQATVVGAVIGPAEGE